MLSQAKLKLIRSLDHKKARRESGLFVAEGPKVVGDLLAAMPARLVAATGDWLAQNGDRIGDAEIIEVGETELRKASFLQHPQQVLALFPIPQGPSPLVQESNHKAQSSKLKAQSQKLKPQSSKLKAQSQKLKPQSLCLALDGVQDPGNLGTIIRLADWFGIDTLYCSHETADAYSPKVVQATMGSLARVRPHYTDLRELIESLPKDYPVYGTLLDGEDIYGQELTPYGLVVMGNEGGGISPAIRPLVNRRLLIPHYPRERATTDSLNVAIATAITCAEFRRRLITI